MSDGAMDEWTVERHLEGQPAASVALYDAFIAMTERIGPFAYAVSKSTITLKGTRRGFAGARPTAKGLSGYLDVQRVIEDDRIRNVSPYTKRLFVHQFLITDASQLDSEFEGWLREAYAVGAGEHLTSA